MRTNQCKTPPKFCSSLHSIFVSRPDPSPDSLFPQFPYKNSQSFIGNSKYSSRLEETFITTKEEIIEDRQPAARRRNSGSRHRARRQQRHIPIKIRDLALTFIAAGFHQNPESSLVYCPLSAAIIFLILENLIPPQYWNQSQIKPRRSSMWTGRLPP